MNLIKKLRVLLFCLILPTLPLASLTVKLGSVVPAGSDWDLALKQLANDWRSITGGAVSIKIYPGGIVGSEENMIQKIRIGQLDMAVLTAEGMKGIVPESFVLSLPFLYNNDDEVNYMLKYIAPEFDNDFREKGFEVLMWSSTGWIHFFSKERATTPDLLREEKVGVSNTDSDMTSVWKSLNFRVVNISINDTMTGLQSGMIDSFYTSPMGAAAYQWFAFTPHMNDYPISPLLGGIVISQKIWNRIPAKYHKDLKDAVIKTNSKFNTYSKEMNDEALKVMVENGLIVDTPTESESKQWDNLFDENYSLMVGEGKMISSESFNMVRTKLRNIGLKY